MIITSYLPTLPFRPRAVRKRTDVTRDSWVACTCSCVFPSVGRGPVPIEHHTLMDVNVD